MPSPLRNGDIAARVLSPAGHFRSTVSDQKLRRLNALAFLFRFAAFCFSLAAAVFMLADSSRSPASPSWTDFSAFRFVLAANAIVAVYSFAEMGAALWEIMRGATPLPESVQLWFDFSHDQVFAYLLLAAEAAGTKEALGLKRGRTCAAENAFCVQAYISIGLGFAGFAFLALSALISGYRVVCYVITGARFHL